MIAINSYVYKKEIDWSLLTEGLTLPLANQVVFARTMNRFLQRGEHKPVRLMLGGVSYDAAIYNLKFNTRYQDHGDMLQIRYKKNGDLAQKLQEIFRGSYQYFAGMRAEYAEQGKRAVVKLPEDMREYLAIYTTEFDDTYLLEPITLQDTDDLRIAVRGWPERVLETIFNYDIPTPDAGIYEIKRIAKIARLNRSIGENLKLLYGCRCQICGQPVGSEADTSALEAHHISFFTESLNSDMTNQMVLCPNHHSVIHSARPLFDRKQKLFRYENGFTENLMLNQHI